MHGDLHGSNVMLVHKNGLVYPCIVDFGFTCINVNAQRYAFDDRLDQSTDYNPSRDLLFLIWTIYFNHADQPYPTGIISEWCKTKLEESNLNMFLEGSREEKEDGIGQCYKLEGSTIFTNFVPEMYPRLMLGIFFLIIVF